MSDVNRESLETFEAASDIAIIGMACRFPGASNVEEFWHNLCSGVEAISFFEDQELMAAGVSRELLDDPHYVKAGAVLKDAELFDAEFFGYSRRGAEILNPQHRLLLECTWEALENAGYDPQTYDGQIGLYAGAGLNTYLFNIYEHPELMRSVGDFQAMLANDKDSLCTTVSYKLNLRGPSVSVQTFCSTSLVAVHMACQSLLNAECDMALAGGVALETPQNVGYLHQEGGIGSPDGHCRAFDARAAGTIRGNGVGAVVLKRLEDARRQGDSILAIIKGSAVNNDGSRKVGYTAPSVEGQARVILEAQAIAGVRPETISYIEAHGTGTALGDPIEVEALSQVFRADTEKKSYCAIGSVKTNIGHLDAAAGVAGLIKTILALQHKQLPPSLHFEAPNPAIDFANSPFYVNTMCREWEQGSTPRRAGVSSFGIGGTNAHVILEEAPPVPVHSPASRPWQVLVLSGRSESSLDVMSANLADYLIVDHQRDLRDVAYTLQVGRRAFTHRRAVVCQSLADAAQALKTLDVRRVITSKNSRNEQPQIAFMFPGQGAQYVGMAAELYSVEPVFREQLDLCARLLGPHLGCDLRNVLFSEKGEAATQRLNQTCFTQPALFAVEYALAQLWMSWGVHPRAMIGHSIGEYVAACLAGVFSLEDALWIVAQRGRMMQALPAGSMLAVPLPEKDARAFLNEHISLAALNTPVRCVLSGSTEAINELELQLTQQGIVCRRLHTSHAFHSSMMDPICTAFTDILQQVRFNRPTIPYLSNVTGTWITDQEATDPVYWARHLRETVRFTDGIQMLLQHMSAVLLEVGPGQTLGGLVREHREAVQASGTFSSLGGPRQTVSDLCCILQSLGHVWLAGVEVEWQKLWQGESPRRIALPAYPFERERYWIASAGEKHISGTAQLLTQSQPLTQASSKQMIEEEKVVSTMKVSSMASVVPTASTQPRPDLRNVLTGILADLLGITATAVDCDLTFLDMGIDSLAMLQVSQSVQKSFGITVPFRMLLEECPTISDLAAYIEKELPPIIESAPAPVPSASASIAHLPSAAQVSESSSGGEQSATVESVERIMMQQLALMTQQLEVLSGWKGMGSQAEKQIKARAGTHLLSLPSRFEANASSAASEKPPVSLQKAYVPFKPVDKARSRPGNSLMQSQRDYLESLMARFTRRTGGSKELAQQYRPWLADARLVDGFRSLIKDMVYPIVIKRGAGAKVWDVDGNEYIDIAMGFGTLLFGHSPTFLTSVLSEQLTLGARIGPHQSEMGGQVAALLCELTGLERAAFCNSGTEAVMAALRLARAVTGRNKVVFFAGSYHGTFDGVLAIPDDAAGSALNAAPMCPGVPPGMVQDVFVLPYDSPDVLGILKSHAHELAAVLVEPLQSRRPDWLPVDLLHALRQFTAEAKVALIFDEVVTGFRLHQKGILAELDVQPDIVTYGKVLGSGLPVGVVAGKAAFMDAIDGGMWSYEDDSYPRANQTLYAGTYFENPLVMAGVWAVLDHLKQCGPDLYTELNARTARLAETVNTYCKQVGAPLEVVHHGSLFTFRFFSSGQNSDLFFYSLLDKGIYTRKGQLPCFLSTAHTAEDIEHIIVAIKEAIAEMQGAGFFPSSQLEVLASEQEQTLSPAEEADGKKHVPLTPQQEELWIMAQMGEGALRAYGEAMALHLHGPLNLPALQNALQTLVDRHESLRTTFALDGQYQEIAPFLTHELAMVDLAVTDHKDEETEQHIAAWLANEADRPFDLEHGPLLRTTLLKISEIYHVLAICCHHIIMDGWSLGIFFDELSCLYSATRQGIPRELPAPASYSAYARQYHARLKNQEISHSREYWLSHLSLPLPVLQLPTDKLRPATLTFNGACETAIIDASLCAFLKELGARHRCTLFATLLATYALLLYRLTGQEDVVIGTLAAGQIGNGNEQLVGHCVNLLPLRLQTGGDLSFLQYMTMVQKTVLEAFDHRDYPFIHLIGELNPPRDPSRHPLVATIFNFERAAELSFFELSATVVASPAQTTKFDISLNATERNGQIFLECTYNTDLFTASTIGRMLDHYQTLLSSAVADPCKNLMHLPIMSVAEKQMIAKWNETSVDYILYHSLQQLIEAQVERTPTAIAITCGEQQVTYTQLNQRANVLAHHLIASGIGPEMRVGLCLERTADMVAAILGILKAGGAYVPLDPAYPSARLAYILEDAQCSVLLTQTSLLDQLPDTIAHILCLEEIDESATTLSSMLNPAMRVNAANLAYIIYTSGSTGVPKGVAITHSSAVAFLQWACDTFSQDDLAVALAATSICFDLSVFELWAPLSCGGEIILVENALHIPALSKVTLINTVPSVMVELLRIGLPETTRIVNLAGEPLVSDLVDRIYRQSNVQQIFNLYGPSEDTTYSTYALIAREHIGAVPIGQPIANTCVYILDNACQLMPIGIPGELYIGGAGLARGYLGRPALTAERFVPDPFGAQEGGRLYKTGDLACWRPDGSLEFLGRIDHQVKLRGFRIELGEIEAVLRAHPTIEETVVLVREDSSGDRYLVAYLVPANEEEPAVEGLRLFLGERLPAYMVPTAYVKLSALPLTPNGKLDRQALPAPDGQQLIGTKQQYIAPRTPLEQQVAQICAEVLGGARVGLQDNFFDLGGHSLKAIQVISRIQQSIGVKIELHHVFEDPTVSGLTRAIERNQAQSQQNALPEFETPLFLHDELSDEQQLADLLQYLGGVSSDELEVLLSHVSNGKK